MYFKTEKDRLLHPNAKLIPSVIWECPKYFNKQLSNDDLYFLSASLEEIFKKKYHELDKKSKYCALAAILMRYPIGDGFKLLYFATKILFLTPVDIFDCAAALRHGNLFNALRKYVGVNQLESTIMSDGPSIFRRAAENGHLEVLNWFKESVPKQIEVLIKSGDYIAFQNAAQNGHLEVLKWFQQHAPRLFEYMLKVRNYSAFRYAAQDGHLEILKWFQKQAPKQFEYMIKATNYSAFRYAAHGGHLEVLEWLIKEQDPRQLESMIRGCNYEAFNYAVDNGHMDVVQMLIKLPSCFAHAECHQREYGQKYVHPFVEDQLKKMHQEQENFLKEQPNGVFDLSHEQARLCFYMLRNLIRRNVRDLDDEFLFLLSIPAVKNIVHQAVSPNEPNELLRLALSMQNTHAATLLLDIPAVRTLAVQNNYYALEQQGALNLRELAQSRESSMKGLTSGEQKRLSALTKEYEPMLKNASVHHLMDDLRSSLKARYELNPATIQVGTIPMKLPFGWKELQALQLSREHYKLALKAYYQHRDHTAFRYISKPNPWMHQQAAYVNMSEDRSLKWSSFEEYQPLIALLWLAAQDENQEAIDGHSIEGRINHFIDELAHICRGHNWDKSRETKEGKSEEYDDLEGDRPSCYSGVKRRLFQSLIGHPLMTMLTKEIVQQEIHDFVKAHFISKINEQNREALKIAMTTYEENFYMSLDEKNNAILNSLNVSELDKKQLLENLGKKYGAQFNEDIALQSHVLKELALDKYTVSSHAMKFIGSIPFEHYIGTSSLQPLLKDEPSSVGLKRSRGFESKNGCLTDKQINGVRQLINTLAKEREASFSLNDIRNIIEIQALKQLIEQAKEFTSGTLTELIDDTVKRYPSIVRGRVADFLKFLKESESSQFKPK